MIRIGTSGYSYNDWSGIVYPESMDKKNYLSHYSQFFNITEINSTYYRIPSPYMFLALLKKVPQNFEFVVKLSKEFTHERNKMGDVLDEYKEGIQPLVDTGRLITLLAQFPYSFKPTKGSYEHLEKIREAMGDIPINVEFRNEYWINDKTFDFLKENNLGYVCVDMPPLPRLVPPIVKATSNVGYIRFHGRVKENWWNPPKAWMRYDYLYDKNELAEWVPKVKKLEELAGQVVIFLNNHYRGKAARNAVTLSQLLDLSPPSISKDSDQMEFLSTEDKLV